MKRLSVSLWLALCVALPASAQMYKWVDSDGKVRYSDRPPPSNVKTEKLKAPAQPASRPAPEKPKEGEKKSGPMTTAEREQAFRKRQAEADKSQKEQAQKQAKEQERAERCTRAREALANLELGGRQTRINEKGERVFLDERQISQETARAREAVATACAN